ncbi:antigen 5 like allergen Cul n 1 [Stomoxys calcitrans]|uniref:antigen 5 like allergen Cul n 1 n=1 Tax=Stomoxys calcitrans TaxID=35570 RepID=UPI0027E26FAA|nr:antigen 5 like allergen Cul n 1 [Stomoxys calcitrans]
MLTHQYKFVFSTITMIILNLVQAKDYCNPSLCRKDIKHIGCKNNGHFSSTCPSDARMVNMDGKLKTTLVKAHNEKRNFIAGGGDRRHSPACNMATIEWDDELASLAALNVRQCRIVHDKCHNTDLFKFSGQNLYLSSFTSADNDADMLRKAVESWFKENENSRMQFINKYPGNDDAPTIGHFTVMMADRNTRVGCAAATYTEAGKFFKWYLLACNYATTNMKNQSIYSACRSPASGCKTRTNPAYPNLCTPAEKYDVNKMRS